MSERPCVLLIAAANATSGGGERHVADLLDRLPEAGIDVALICPPGGALTTRAEARGVPVVHVAIQRGMSVGTVAGVRRAIDTVAPDVVHAHGARAALFARLADRHASERCVYTVHGIHADKAGSAARRGAVLGIERLLRARTAHFVAVCEADVAKGARLGILDPSRTTVVYNGVAIPRDIARTGAFRRELGVAEDAPLVLSVGRFHEQKDQATLLRAWREVVSQRHTSVLALVGEGELAGHLREVTRAQGLGDSVRFVAPRDGLSAAYADADAFALSSRWEGLPYVVLEAMAFGIPVVATAVDGVPEAVVDGETGLLVPSQDAPALGAALNRVLADRALGQRLGEAGRRRVAERFSLQAMTEGLLGVYERVIVSATQRTES